MAETGQELSDRARAHKQLIVQFLTRETGITEAQARELVDMMGNSPGFAPSRGAVAEKAVARPTDSSTAKACR
ncbi:hypothetical protein CK220_23895 [Mesorhizobium sp. WSM3860]|nr:hypothetical protein CK220_23895 [Mesorhizobium sp. WSM3860]